jgi:hypothetical protein
MSAQSLLPPQYQSPTLTIFQSADEQSNQVAETKYITVRPSLSQLRTGSLCRIANAGGVHVQQLHPPFHADDTLLGELQLPSYDALLASQ